MSTQIENDNKKIISKIMQIQLISNVSSITVSPEDNSLCSMCMGIMLLSGERLRSERFDLTELNE